MTSTRGIVLLPLDARTLDLAGADARAWAAGERLTVEPVADIVEDVARRTREYLLRTGVPATWGAFLAMDGASRGVVGTCAFKGAPDRDGTVEIAYYTFLPYEGRGFATGMAAALAERAAASGEVRTVRAHTLPERNASVRVLEKLGFRFTGEVVDPEDGPVWRWERPVADRAPGG